MPSITEDSVRRQMHDAGFKVAASQMRGMHLLDLNYLHRSWNSFTNGSRDVFTDGNYSYIAPRKLSKKRIFDGKKVVVR